jgi:hypothetical protein
MARQYAVTDLEHGNTITLTAEELTDFLGEEWIADEIIYLCDCCEGEAYHGSYYIQGVDGPLF